MAYASRSGLPAGVSRKRYPRGRPFMATVKQNGRKLYLGNFASPEEAGEAVVRYKREGIICRLYCK
jgi:hypothetical protein